MGLTNIPPDPVLELRELKRRLAILEAKAIGVGTSGGTIDVQEEGSTIGTRGKLNFVGANVTAVDNSGQARVDVTVKARHEVTLTRTGALVVETGLVRWYPPVAITIVGVRASVNTAPTGASILVDVNKNGTTIFTTQSNRPEIAAAGFTDLSGTPDVTGVSIGDYLQVDIDQIGSTVAGSNLTVTIEYTVP